MREGQQRLKLETSVLEREAVEDTGSPEDEDTGEMWEEVTVEGEDIHDWNTDEARIMDMNTHLLTDVPEATD